MNDFFELETSPVLKDRLDYNVFIEFITQLFGLNAIDRTQTYRYLTQLETEENRQMILDNWNVLCFFGECSDIFKKNKRLVFWVLDHAINYLNETYQFKNPLKFEHVRIIQQAEPKSKRTITLTYYNLNFV